MLEPGQIFATRYRVIRTVAHGGMGAVFEAQHTTTERRVALKLLWPHVLSVDSAREKFELEAKISARLSNPHIVEVLDAGVDEATRSPYLVMELLAGNTLAGHIKQHGALNPCEALELLGQAAVGLDAAHGYRDAQGRAMPIVHRDLKPENLFISQGPGTGARLKILDFGIAKVLSESTQLSQEVRGTPLYMAYEQVIAGALSPQTDIWALGLIAHVLLTGRGYWRAASNPGAGIQALFAEIVTLPLQAPRERLREGGETTTLPAGYDAWLLRCLDRDPKARFESAGAAVRELAEVLTEPSKLDAAALPEGNTGATAADHGRLPSKIVPNEAETAVAAASQWDTRVTSAASVPALSSERSGPRRPEARSRSLWIIASLAALALTSSVWLYRKAVSDAPPRESVVDEPPIADRQTAPAARPLPREVPPSESSAVEATPSRPAATAIDSKPVAPRDTQPPPAQHVKKAPRPRSGTSNASRAPLPARNTPSGAAPREPPKKPPSTAIVPSPTTPATAPFDPYNER